MFLRDDILNGNLFRTFILNDQEISKSRTLLNSYTVIFKMDLDILFSCAKANEKCRRTNKKIRLFFLGLI
jgi:hypothetical protein